MSFPGPLFLLIGPLVLAALTVGLLRWSRVTAWVGTAGIWLLARLLVTIPLQPGGTAATPLFAGDTWTIWGRSLVLTERTQFLMLFLYVGLGLLFFVSIAFFQSRHFVPLSLLTLSPLAAALMIRPFTFGALFLFVAAGLVVGLIQARQGGVTQPASRYLILSLLTTTLFLVAGWMLETEQVTFHDAITRLLILIFVILLAGFPFFIWVIPIVERTPVLLTVFLFGLVQFVVIAFIYAVLETAVWLRQDALFGQMIQWSGLLTVLIAGLLALSASKEPALDAEVPAAETGPAPLFMKERRLLGALLLLDMGMALLTVGIGWQTAVWLHVARFCSLLLAGIGLQLWQSQMPLFFGRSGKYISLSGCLFGYGCASLLGLPLTVGFGSRWMVLAVIGGQNGWLLVLLLAGMAAAAYGLWQCCQQLFYQGHQPAPVMTDETRFLQGVVGLLMIVALITAIWPQWLFLPFSPLMGVVP